MPRLNPLSEIKSINERRNNRELIAISEIQMTGIPTLALSRSGHLLVEMNALTYFPEESTTTPEHDSSTSPPITPFTSQTIYRQKKV
jgi:hypothetical protein